MKDNDVKVYDAYLDLFNELVKTTRTVQGMPLDSMLTALDQVESAGCYNTRGHTLVVIPEAAAQHRLVIEAARAFRDAVAGTVAGPGTDPIAGGTGPVAGDTPPGDTDTPLVSEPTANAPAAG